MKVRLAFAAAIGLLSGLLSAADDDAGKILRPADNSSYATGQIDLVATAPSGTLQLDGISIQAEQPFPDVFHATLKASIGLHSLVLLWEGGKEGSAFSFVGPTSASGVSTVSPASADSGRAVHPMPWFEPARSFCL